MRPYSPDLRQKIVDAYLRGDRSQRQLAKDFGVALSFIHKLIKRYRETGSIAPKVRTSQTPTKLNPEQLEVLKTLISEQNDATLPELQERLESRTGMRVSTSTISRMLDKLNITRKKKTLHAAKKETEKV